MREKTFLWGPAEIYCLRTDWLLSAIFITFLSPSTGFFFLIKMSWRKIRQLWNRKQLCDRKNKNELINLLIKIIHTPKVELPTAISFHRATRFKNVEHMRMFIYYRLICFHPERAWLKRKEIYLAFFLQNVFFVWLLLFSTLAVALSPLLFIIFSFGYFYIFQFTTFFTLIKAVFTVERWWKVQYHSNDRNSKYWKLFLNIWIFFA